MSGFRFARAGGGTGERVTDPVRCDRFLTYLRGGAPLGGGYRTDGRWIWPQAVIDELVDHQRAPEPELSQRIAALGYYCPAVTQAMVDDAVTALRQQTAP